MTYMTNENAEPCPDCGSTKHRECRVSSKAAGAELGPDCPAHGVHSQRHFKKPGCPGFDTEEAHRFVSAPAPERTNLRTIVTRLIEFLAKPLQDKGGGMADCADSELSKLLRDVRELSSQEGE